MCSMINVMRRLLLGLATLSLAISSGLTQAIEEDLYPNNKQITGSQLVKTVLTRNPDIPAMRAAWEAAQSRIVQAEALDDPMLSYLVAPQTAGQSGMDFGQKLTLSQRLPWPGKIALRGDVARYESDAAYERIERVRLKLAEATKVAYANWFFVHAALRINNVNKTLLQEFQRIAKIKYATGRVSKQDVLRAEVEYTLLEHRDIVLERRRKECLAMLNTLLQRLPDLPLPPPAGLPKTILLPAISQLRAAALEHYPDLRVLAARLQASRRREALAERNYYPDITLNAGYNSLWNQDEKRFTVGAAINIPLQGKRRAAKDGAQAETLRLSSQQHAKVSQIMNEVQQYFEQVRESEHVLTLYRDRLLPLAEENLEAARSDYQSGSGNFLDLISAEKNLMQTQLQLEQAQADYYQRLASLEKTVGGMQALHPSNTGEDEV